MLASVITSAVAYLSTNIDDIFVIMVLLAQARKGTKGQLVAGHFLGVGFITAISMLGALGLQNFPLRYVGILGLVPIFLGIKAWRNGGEDDDVQPKNVSLLSMAMITLGNGGDNIGVYIPLFTGYTAGERIAAVAVFAIMTGSWVYLANALAEFPRVKAFVDRYKRIVIPAVLIILGIYIILDSGLIGG